MARLIQAMQKYGPKVERSRTAPPEHVAGWLARGTGLNVSQVEMVLRELAGVVPREPAQAGAAVVVPGDVRRVPQAVVRLAEAVVVRARDQLRDRLRVAVGRVQVEPRIDRHAERVHLPAGPHLDTAAVRLEAEAAGLCLREIAVLGMRAASP
mgnify:CR=1 FL=1